MNIAGISRYVTLTLFAGVMAFQASAQENEEATGFVVDEIISKVDNYIVLKSDLDRLYQDQLTNGRPPGQQLRCQLLAMLIRNKLMMAKAEIDSVMVLDAEVDQNTQRRMDMILSQSGRSPDELEELYGKVKPGRYNSLAITALEESVMWIVKELTS